MGEGGNNVRYATLSEARAGIRDADVLLFRRHDVIAAAGRGIHNHAALVAWWDGEPFCLEVRGGYGGRAVTLQSQIERYPGRIDLYSADPDASHPLFDRRGAVRHFHRWLGRPYGYLSLLSLALRRLPLLRLIVPPSLHDEENGTSAPFCSQACAEALRKGGGVDPVPNLADRMTEPADLARSTFLRYRCTLLPDDAGRNPPSCQARNEAARMPPAAVIFLTLVLGLLHLPIAAGGSTCADGSCGIPASVGEAMPRPPSVFQGPSPSVGVQSTPAAAVARIANVLNGGMAAYGTGTLIAKDDRRGWVLTCAHLFRDGAGRLTVYFTEGAFAARLLACDAEGDLALLEIAAPAADPLPIRQDVPAPGEGVTFLGYGAAGPRTAIPAGRSSMAWAAWLP